MTYIEILNKFSEEFPNADVDDYRPSYSGFVKDKVGLTIWLKNGDMILYYPKLTQEEK